MTHMHRVDAKCWAPFLPQTLLLLIIKQSASSSTLVLHRTALNPRRAPSPPQTLLLAGCGLGDGALASLDRTLAGNTAIRTLDLSRNAFTATGVGQLVRGKPGPCGPRVGFGLRW